LNSSVQDFGETDEERLDGCLFGIDESQKDMAEDKIPYDVP
jgi:hypothetical protein